MMKSFLMRYFFVAAVFVCLGGTALTASATTVLLDRDDAQNRWLGAYYPICVGGGEPTASDVQWLAAAPQNANYVVRLHPNKVTPSPISQGEIRPGMWTQVMEQLGGCAPASFLNPSSKWGGTLYQPQEYAFKGTIVSDPTKDSFQVRVDETTFVQRPYYGTGLHPETITYIVLKPGDIIYLTYPDTVSTGLFNAYMTGWVIKNHQVLNPIMDVGGTVGKLYEKWTNLSALLHKGDTGEFGLYSLTSAPGGYLSGTIGVINISSGAQQTQTGTVQIRATLDGQPWVGAVVIDYTYPTGSGTNYSAETTGFTTQPIGTYSITYRSGGPPNATFTNITPSATQYLAAGRTITWTFTFVSQQQAQTGTIRIKRADANLDPLLTPPTSAWADSISPSTLNPADFTGLGVGTHTASATDLPGFTERVGTCTYPIGGSICGPITAYPLTPACDGIKCSMPVAVQSGLVTKVVFQYTIASQQTQTGTVQIRATLDGQPWVGAVVIDYTYPTGSGTNYSAETTGFTTQPIGTYSITYRSGGPYHATFSGMTCPQGASCSGNPINSVAQYLATGRTITWTFNFVSQLSQQTQTSTTGSSIAELNAQIQAIQQQIVQLISQEIGLITQLLTLLQGQ